MMQFAAILLAAGRSQRMGQLKSLLEYGGKTFWQHSQEAIASLHPAASVAVVSAALNKEVADSSDNGTLLVNEEPDRGQLYSLKLALAELSEQETPLEGAFLFLVDNQGALKERTAKLHEAVRAGPGSALAAGFEEQPGHPIWLPARLWGGILRYEGEEGLRGFLASAGEEPAVVESGSPWALKDIDRPEDFQEFLREFGS